MARLFLYLLFLIVCLLLIGFIWTQYESRQIQARFPPAGAFETIDGVRLHFVDTGGAGLPKSAPTVLFIHGASGNLLDGIGAFRKSLEGRARLIFVDRPGHGYSERGNETYRFPGNQAKLFQAFLKARGVEKAIVAGHSYGGATAMAMGVHTPDSVSGLVLMGPATHPWPGPISWYYEIASKPIIGPLLAHTVVVPFSKLTGSLQKGIEHVFAPSSATPDYGQKSGVELLLRPSHFLANANDVAALYESVVAEERFYDDVSVPVGIVTGQEDDVVSPHYHSRALKKAMPQAVLRLLPNVGHKPDYTATDVVLEEIERVAKEAGTPLATLH